MTDTEALRRDLAQDHTACPRCGGRGLLDVERDERGLQIGAQEEFCVLAAITEEGE